MLNFWWIGRNRKIKWEEDCEKYKKRLKIQVSVDLKYYNKKKNWDEYRIVGHLRDIINEWINLGYKT